MTKTITMRERISLQLRLAAPGTWRAVHAVNCDTDAFVAAGEEDFPFGAVMRITGKQPGQGYADALFIAAAVNASRAWIDQGVELAGSPDLAELRSFEAAATPGPWTLHDNAASASFVTTEAGTFPYNVVAHRGFTSSSKGHHDTAMAYLATEHARSVLGAVQTMAIDEFLATFPPRPQIDWSTASDRLWSQRRGAMDMLATSMQERGQVLPVRIGPEGWVFDGIQRVAVAMTLGLPSITYVVEA